MDSTFQRLRARFKVTDSLNATKMAKYSLVITPTRRHHVEWLDQLDQPQPIPRSAKKSWRTLVHKQKSSSGSYWPNPSGQFFGDYISAIRECCALKYLHALEIDQGYLAHTPTATGVSSKIFNRENLKFGLKFSMWASITGAGGSILTKLLQTTCSEAGVIICVQFLEGPPLKICEGQKTSIFRRDFWQLSTLIANISGTDRHIEHQKKNLINHNPALGEKMVNFGPETKNTSWLILINQLEDIFWDYISAIGVLAFAASNFYTRLTQVS